MDDKELDTKLIKVNTEYTYKKLCELLNEPIKTGNQKNSQVNNWKRYFTYNKISNKYYITTIKKTPLPPSRKGKYAKYLEDIFFRYLLSNKSSQNIKIYSYSSLWQVLGMVNIQYNEYMDRANREKLLEYFIQEEFDPMTMYEINDFYFRTKEKFRSVIDTLFNRLENKMLIKIKIGYTITKKYHDYDNNGSIISGNIETREANQVDIENWLSVSRKVLLDMGYSYISDVFVHNKNIEFYNKVEKELLKYYPECKEVLFYKYREIVFNRDDILNELKLNQSKESDLDQDIIKFNKEIVKIVNKQAKDNYTKYLQKIKDDNKEDNNVNDIDNVNDIVDNKWCYPREYPMMQRKLTDKLINIKIDEIEE